MHEVLRLACIPGGDAQQLSHQIDQPAKQRKKDKSHDTGWDRNPDRGNCRPAPHIAVIAKSGYVDQHDHAKEQDRRQHDRQNDLADPLPAMSSI